MNIAKTPSKTPTLVPVRPRPGAGGVEILARSYRSGVRLDPHMHREAQLVFAAKGVMQVQTPRGVWLVPPERAVWVPPRLEHAIDVLSDIEMRTVYFQSRWLAKQKVSAAIANEFVVRVGALMREAVLAMFEPQCDTARKLTLARLVVMDLRDAGDASTFMPMPQHPKARQVANIILGDPTADRDLEELAAEAGISGRTLTRLFPAQTKLTLKSWKQRARVIAAIERLGQPGVSIKQVAAALGFSSTAAFSFAFRDVTGETPTAFLSRKDEKA
ncbi:helix-turn-helix transcriptional regulator [Bradyrhizobium sp. LHD-71]|uniref:AraC family transcriptional regulator n=1 Tax=Bradyrhizobium sp. LHD-71 TaxID=3072141 RepID=UPI00280F6908|nr:helix-turn-helix transcriptional regulator [Bradyrhizobium sp. LHD-71]MDQ8732711.1 helix-turn-helix transcriptional regulator [Bradyrhizobium sp. LHD-71]